MTIEIEVDPVCGKPVDTTQSLENGLSAEFEGREYVFCGPGCQKTFLRRPIAYAVAGRTAP